MIILSLTNKVNHIFEPNSLACGQAVISMLADRDVNEVINLVKTDREIDLKTMISALKQYDINCNRVKKEAKKISDLPQVCVLSLETPRCWHWSLFFKGKVYDPEHGVLDDFPVSNRKYYFEIEV